MTKLHSLPLRPEPVAQTRLARSVSNQRESWLRQMELMQLSAMDSSGRATSRMEDGRIKPAAEPSRGPIAQQQNQPTVSDRSKRAHSAMPSGSLAPVLAVAFPAHSSCGARVSIAQDRVTATSVPNEVAADSATPLVAPPPSSPLQQAGMQAPRVAAAPGPAMHAQPMSPKDGASGISELMCQYAKAWPARLMHLTGAGQDVDLWIRDTDLSEDAAATLVAQVVRDSASHGMHLRSVTLNGKLLRSTADQSDMPTKFNQFDLIQKKDNHGAR